MSEHTNADGMKGGKDSTRLAPHDVFTVPEGIRHLPPERMEILAQAFDKWCGDAQRADSIRSRERIRLLFLILRYSGARLGEVTGLDDTKDLDLDTCMITLGHSDGRRNIPLPRSLCRDLRTFLEGPMGAGLQGKAFCVDHGYVRRVFYARADDCGLPRELACPRALRSTRAVELLRRGVPLAVVRDMLGQSSTDLASVFQTYSSNDACRIVRRLSPDDQGVSSSARNSFLCSVQTVTRDTIMAEISLETSSGLPLYAVITAESLDNMELAPGVSVVATIKAPLVDVSKDAPGIRSARNMVRAVITTIRTTPVLAEISGLTPDGTPLCSLMSAGTIKNLNLAPGDTAEFRFKALSVVLNAT